MRFGAAMVAAAIAAASAVSAEPLVVPLAGGPEPGYGAARVIYDPATFADPVPMRVVRGTHPLLRVTVGDRAYDLLIDTGATRTWLPPDVPGRPSADRRVVERLCFANAVCFEDAVVEAAETPFTVAKPGYYNGLLGMDLLSTFDVTLDYLRGRFYFRDARNADAPAAVEVPYTVDDRTLRPFAPVTATGARLGEVLLDTGAVVTRITPRMYRRLDPPPPRFATRGWRSSSAAPAAKRR